MGLKDLQTQHVREAIWKKGPVFSLNGLNWFDHQTAILGEEFRFCTQVMLVILDLLLYVSIRKFCKKVFRSLAEYKKAPTNIELGNDPPSP